MGKDELFRERILKLLVDLAISRDPIYMQTKITPEETADAILAWFLENLPKEIKTAEEDKDRVLYQQYVEGWNSCLAEIKRRMNG